MNGLILKIDACNTLKKSILITLYNRLGTESIVAVLQVEFLPFLGGYRTWAAQ